jgi:hypothetical protein
VEPKDEHWLRVIGRSLAFLCLAQADMRDKGVGEQATFLHALGLERADIAQILNTTEESVRVQLHKAKGRKGGRGGAKKKGW